MFKKTLVFLILASAYHVQAQSTDTLTPLKGDKQFLITYNTNGSVGFLFKKYFSNTLAWRLGANGRYNTSKTGDVIDNTTTVNGVVQPNSQTANDNSDIYSKDSQTNFNIFLGLQKSFLVQKRFEPYIGADLLLGTSSSTNKNSNVYYSSPNGTVERTVKAGTIKNTPGINIGINTFLGFNYYITSRFALGTEFSISPITFNQAGKYKTEADYINTTTGYYNTNSTSQKGNTSFVSSINGNIKITATILLNKR